MLLGTVGVAVAQEATETPAPVAQPAVVEPAAPPPAPVPTPAPRAPAPTPAVAAEPEAPALPRATPAPAAAAPAAPRKPVAPEPAPGERIGVIGVLDKRLGTTADFTLKPGERFQFGRLSGIMRTCERTQPFERKQSAAFVQVVEQPPTLQGKPKPALRTVFSGWLFAESPSLNPFVHPVYDVWLKSCAMHFPDGPKPPASPSKRPARKPAAAAPSPPSE